MYTKDFEVVFSVNGSLIDDKNVYKGKLKYPALFFRLKKTQKLNISRLKRAMALKICTPLELNTRIENKSRK